MSTNLNSREEKTIDDFLKVIDRDFSELGGVWPVTAAQIKGYFHDIFYSDLYLKYLQNPEKFKQAISLLPITVLRIFLLRDSILALKIARKYHNFKITKEELINFFLSVVKVIEEKTWDNPFSLNRELLIFGKKQIDELLTGKWLEHINGDEKEINNFSITLQSFVWSVQFDVFSYGVYWHGPYQVGGETFLLVKELFDFNLPFWEKIDHSKARICYLFSQKGDMGVDAVGNLVYKTDIWKNLLKTKVFLDDRELKSINEIKGLDKYFSEARKRQTQIVSKLTPPEIIKKGIIIYHYMFHEFFEFYKEDWKPPLRINERISQVGLYYWNKFSHSGESFSREERRIFLTKLYDLRNDFTG